MGQALGKNPLSIVVPCHRIIAGDGKLGGFTGGLKYKKYLLALEKGIIKDNLLFSFIFFNRCPV